MCNYLKLTPDQIESALAKLGGWTLTGGKLHREYKFKDFIHAFGFMATSALAIEKMNHHPDWSNVYNRVTVDLITHDAKAVTQADTDLAGTLEEIARKFV